jgi:GR25 family glycosyltransferase involved in LPS biosynthesis
MFFPARHINMVKSQIFSVVVSTAVTTFLVLSLHASEGGRRPPPLPYHDHREEFFSSSNVANTTAAAKLRVENLYDVQNRTLGCQEVKMISMPFRGDRQDAFAMQAVLSGISYDQVDGVNGSTIPKKAQPHRMDQDDQTVGCWRAHVNVWRDMILRNVQSTMIFEDDADWDVAFKSQLVQFARGSRWLEGVHEGDIPTSPYGDDWDILWLGHDAVSDESPYMNGEKDSRRWVIPNDPTVLPVIERTEKKPWPDMSAWEGDEQTRIVLYTTWSLNTAAYAVSQRGARKLLYHLSMLPFNDAVDQGMGWMCKYQIAGIKCIAPFPAMVGVSKPPGGADRWSDISDVEEWAEGRKFEMGFSLRVMFSTRQNIDRLLNGEKKFISKQGTEMHIDEIGAAVGHSQYLDVFPKLKLRPEDSLPPDRERMRVVDFTPKLKNGG